MELPTLKIFIVAGEPSGDVLGERLIKALRQLSERSRHSNTKVIGLNAPYQRLMGANKIPQQQLEFKGIGGPLMAAQGLDSLADIADLSVMGLLEILPRFFRLKKILKDTEQAILDFNPDIIITIDSPGFNLRLMKRVAHKIKARKVHYVAPTVWAWKPKRAEEFAKYYDLMLTLFPFEPDYFTKAGLDTKFVGHSVLEMPLSIKPDREKFCADHGCDTDSHFMLLMPGSRHGEVKRHLPVFGETLAQLHFLSQLKLSPIIITLPHLEETVQQIIASWPIKPIVLTKRGDYITALSLAEAAIAASGTVTLELAMAALPHIVAYRINPISYRLFKRMVKAPYVNLINILSDKMIVPELLQDACECDKIAQNILTVLSDDSVWESQLNAFQTALVKLQVSSGRTPSQSAAYEILSPQ
ncbi:MAG: lipid-A-disaccharide synthase [Alphaproteobacteria bacterium]